VEFGSEASPVPSNLQINTHSKRISKERKSTGAKKPKNVGRVSKEAQR